MKESKSMKKGNRKKLFMQTKFKKKERRKERKYGKKIYL